MISCINLVVHPKFLLKHFYCISVNLDEQIRDGDFIQLVNLGMFYLFYLFLALVYIVPFVSQIFHSLNQINYSADLSAWA